MEDHSLEFPRLVICDFDFGILHTVITRQLWNRKTTYRHTTLNSSLNLWYGNYAVQTDPSYLKSNLKSYLQNNIKYTLVIDNLPISKLSSSHLPSFLMRHTSPHYNSIVYVGKPVVVEFNM